MEIPALTLFPRPLRGWALCLLLPGSALAATDPIGVGPFAFSFSGRLQHDFLLDSDAPRASQSDQAGRRARLGMRATYDRAWVGTLSVDLVDKPRLRDLSLEYRGETLRVELGRVQEPFGLAETGSSNHTLFMERPSPSSLGPDYGLGATLNLRGDDFGVTLGAFTADDSVQLGGDRNEQALGGRLTYTPLRGARLLHLGAALSRRSSEAAGLRLSGSAETILLGGHEPVSLRDTQERDYFLSGLEVAWRQGPLLLQAEYLQADSDGLVEGKGGYIEAGWVVTGERRAYSTRRGSFGGVEPDRPLGAGGYGAIELGLRYSTTEFSGADEGEVYGLAVNWYPERRLRLSLNLQRVSLDPATGVGIDTNLVQARLQFSF